ncbi:MAG: putative methylcobalamin:homocysteine methyltransferase [Promethearchaeota archaeon]|nr:MAG: putative methylcobalamin:homocysteine methyltransferase [Candidatus Lokiarchaeota archaeon]
MKVDLEGLATTVVGSFPLSNTNSNMQKAFIDQIDIGIDFPCYPQLLSMTDEFLIPLSEKSSNLVREGHKFFLEDDLSLPEEEPIALEYGELVLEFLEKYPDYKKQIKGVKACLTGPFTLASEINLRGEISKGIAPRFFREPKAIMLKKLVEQLARIMKNIAGRYNEMGFDIISMDEPILSLLIGRKTAFFDEKFYIQILNEAISKIEGISSIHVCGRISPNLRDLLLKTNVNILDHEFQTSKSNFDIFKREHFTEPDRFLAMGTLATNFNKREGASINAYVESISSLKAFIKKGFDMFGRENLIIKPDCGFIPLKDIFDENVAYEITYKKLSNMVSAVKEYK